MSIGIIIRKEEQEKDDANVEMAEKTHVDSSEGKKMEENEERKTRKR